MHNEYNLTYASEELKADKEFIKEIIRGHANKSVIFDEIKDKEFIKEIIKEIIINMSCRI